MCNQATRQDYSTRFWSRARPGDTSFSELLPKRVGVEPANPFHAGAGIGVRFAEDLQQQKGIELVLSVGEASGLAACKLRPGTEYSTTPELNMLTTFRLFLHVRLANRQRLRRSNSCQLGASDAAAVGPTPPAGRAEDVLQACSGLRFYCSKSFRLWSLKTL